MSGRLSRGCAVAWIGTWIGAGVTPASASLDVVFDAPQFLEGVTLTADEDSRSWFPGLAQASDGSVWVLIVRYDGAVRLARWDSGSFHEVAPLGILPVLDRAPGRFIERVDGLLQFAHGNHVWIFQPDGVLVRDFVVTPGWGPLDLGPDGSVYGVGDGVIRVFDDHGVNIRTWSRPGRIVGIAVTSEERVVVLHEDPLTYEGRISVHSPLGELLGTGPWDDLSWDRYLSALPSGNLVTLGTSADASYPSIASYSQAGVQLLSWWWSDPGQADGGCRYAPVVMTEDGAGRLVTATFDWCYSGPRIDVYSPMGPGVIIESPREDVPYAVDGVLHTGRQRFDLPAGSSHTLSVPQQTEVAPGTRQDFVAWSDGGAATHDVLIPIGGAGLRFSLETLYAVSVTATAGGSATASTWVHKGDNFTLSAVADPGYKFVKWSHPESTGWRGDAVLEPEWTHGITKPESWLATFVRDGLVLTVSASDSDPWVNTAAPASGPRQLWLWAACLDRGISALEADVSGSLAAFAFTPESDYLNLGTGPNLLLAISGCPIGADANVRLGSWWVMDNGGDLCLAPSVANGTLGVVDCPTFRPQVLPFGFMGFSSIGEPCRMGLLCGESPAVPDTATTSEPPLVSRAVTTLRLGARGNPFRSSTDLVLESPDDGRATIKIFDVAGRRVRTLWEGAMIAGVRSLTWDGRNESGRAVPGGIYFVNLEAASGRRTLKLVKAMQ